ncbi:hypothetical protein FD754_014312 [Muntiacus muntjak]|uniref:G-protein coupled receptors family 1 profile domain-containing protein n=1 Tax=Muntiacus muntjak TaxID=9888 RepID=A0A5N3VM45_MUNMU|nr:hypothetical protein FD754_014312 [Muntiacus muntjak]
MFILGLSDDPQLQVVIFVFLLITYMLSITGNLTFVILNLLDNFSIFEVSFITVTIPRFLATIIIEDKTISLNDCIIKYNLIVFFSFYLLDTMSYDHYIAICKPLHYMTIMNHGVCTLLVLASSLASFFITFSLLMFSLQLDYCKSNVTEHYTCKFSPILQFSCSDTKFLEIMVFSCAVFTLIFTLALIILSYTYITRTILRIPSTTQRTKAFSTCSSHMIVISISYGSCIFMYMNPSAKGRVSLSKGVAVLNTSVAPMLNPFIYALRN